MKQQLVQRETLETLVEKQSGVSGETQRIAQQLRVTLTTSFDQLVENVYRDLHIEDDTVERHRVESALKQGPDTVSS